MRTRWIFKQKGVTLIELLVALVICGVAIGAIYRLFIVQTRAYTVQDQVVEVQQNVRSVMEIMLRDLRMTGYDDDSTPTVMITTPIVTPLANNSIAVGYEYTGLRYRVDYWTDGSQTLWRQLTINDAVPLGQPEILLQNVDVLNFTYGVDANGDGNMDDQNGDGIINDNDWVAAGGVGTSKVIAVSVTLTARSASVNPDVQMRVSPRTLTSAVTFRNLIMK
jgi:prepilin-type N-terminal cleavage/methylation domain-containing protein